MPPEQHKESAMKPHDPVEEASRESFPASDAPATNVPERAPPFELPQLPYAYEALEPVIDTETMKLHHDKHHRAYVDGLNKALAKHSGAGDSSLETLLRDLAKLPEDIRTSVRNMGGGHYNHTLFWNCMTPHGRPPGAAVRRALDAAFGSFDKFQQAFEAAGTKHFGSGWVYLVANPSAGASLEIVTRPNQDTPLDASRVPIVTCDLWEHAYYLKYHNRRADWLKAWWDVVDWQAAEARLDRAKWA
jgi:Fe-Mn family superoxide dismutase